MNDKMVEIPPIYYDNWNTQPTTQRLELNSTIFAVHSIGKVASKSIFAALKKSIDSPVYHLHYLNEASFNRMYTWFVSNTSYKSNHAEIMDGKSFRNLFLKHKDDLKWKIVTLIREPIAWQISYLFEITLIAMPQLIQGNKFNSKSFYKTIKNSLSNSIGTPIFNFSFYQNWWDSEFSSIFGFDILSKPFDKSKGWEIYNIGNVSTLVIQYEQLNNVFEQAFKEFGISKTISLPEINKTSEKPLGNFNHKKIINEFKLESSILNALYNERIVNHFYNQEQIDSFIRKWKK